MARKAARGGQKTGGRSTRPASRAGSRTDKTRSRTSKLVVHTGRHAAAARREAASPVREHKVHEDDRVPLAHPEDEEDLDWLNEDDDPRSQIVEDNEDPGQEEEW